MHWSSYTSDRDAVTALAVEAAKEECGETRNSDWQYCFLHETKGSHRQLKMSLNLKTAAFSQQPVPNDSRVDPNLPFACPKCGRGVKSNAGRAAHARFCRAEGAVSNESGPTWMSTQGISAKELKPFKKKLLHWVMLRKNFELRRGVAKWKGIKGYNGENDAELKHRLKSAATTIVPCLMGNHEKCIQHSAVCVDGRDPLLHLLPHQRNLPLLPDSVKKTISESVWSLFQSDKLNRLVLGGTLRTTSRVEATHRVIRNPAPKGKPMRRNQTAVLQFGATIAAMKGRGVANLAHFRSLGLPISAPLAKKMKELDVRRRGIAKRRKSAAHRERCAASKRVKFESHAKSSDTKEAAMYRKEGFDHTYAQSSRLAGELDQPLSLVQICFFFITATQ